jgi:hypothetical protein
MNEPGPPLWLTKPHLSDEAAAQLLNFLQELLTGFENAYYDQLRRYYASHGPSATTPRPPEQPDLNQDPF